MAESLEISDVFPTTPAELYAAWLDSDRHSALIGGADCQIDPSVGGSFTAWDGYIEGTTLELEPPHRIVQSWRTSEFPDGAPDSRLEVRFEVVEGGTRLTLHHSDLPPGGAEKYTAGWEENYFDPMHTHYTAG